MAAVKCPSSGNINSNAPQLPASQTENCQPPFRALRLQPEDSTLQFPMPQQAETPTPHLSFFRAPQWQGLSCNTDSPMSRSQGAHDHDGMEEEEDSTPAKSRRDSGQTFQCPRPHTPPRMQKSKPLMKRFRTSSRSSSLNDDKVLFQSQLVRSQSTFKFLDNFVIEVEIGYSKFSKVFKVMHKSTQKHYALKRSARKFSSAAHRDSCLHELSAVSNLPQHPNIVSYYRAWQQNKYVYIQMALCEGGSLADQILGAHMDGGGFSEQRIVEVISDLAQGLEFLHEHHVLHLDIKPDNIFLDSEGRCKIGDFGLAIKDHDTDWQEGDGAYLAPELLASTSPTHAADIYSAGATILECCTGKRLPSDRERLTEMQLGVSEGLQNLVLEMLQPDPSARPSAADISWRVKELYAEHPDWNVPMDQATSMAGDRLQGMSDGSGDADLPASPVWGEPRPQPNPTPSTSSCDSLQESLPTWSQAQQQASPSPFIFAPAAPLAAASPMQPIPSSTPAGSPTVPQGIFSHQTTQNNTWTPQARDEALRLEDTAYCARKQPFRDHWTRKATQCSLNDMTPGFKPPSTPLGSPQKVGEPDAGKPRPRFVAAVPFTAMKSPFQDAACQADDGDSPAWFVRRPVSDSDDTPSLRYSKSLEMEDLQSTVRCLNMCS